jgi:hypothetical protein
MTKYSATYEGQTVTRRSSKRYTHASVVRWGDGTTGIVSFHTSENAAIKGTLTKQQKDRGAAVVAAIPTKVAETNN